MGLLGVIYVTELVSIDHVKFPHKCIVLEIPHGSSRTMSRKRSWLGLIKRLFYPETQQHQQKIKRRRWLFGRLKRTRTLPSSLSPPITQSKSVQTIEHGDEERESKYEDDITKDVSKCEEKLPNSSEINTNDANITPLITEHESDHDQNVAAIKIQTAYRGYLARKALRALKGFVRLQAIIRGRAVRRQAMTTLKCLQSIAKIQSEVCAKRCLQVRVKDGDLQLQDLPENHKIQSCRLRRLDDELLTKEEEIDIILRKKEAILRSKRVKAYSFNHRHSADAVLDGNTQGRLRYWLEQYVGDEVLKKEDKLGGKQHNMKNTTDGLSNFDHIPLPRKSMHRHKKQSSYGEDNLHPSSPINLPTYMAATESAKARTRSTSSPRLRPLHFEAYSDSDSPYKHKFSPMSSINSEATSSGFSKVSNKCSISSSHQKSPSLRGVSGPIRSNKNLK